MSAPTPGPWRYEAGGGHACNSVRGSESVQVHGWPERRNGISNASYSDRICENLGDPDLDGPAANIRLITSAPELLDALRKADDLLGRHEGSAKPEFEGARPTVRINGEDHAELLAVLRAAIAKAEGRT